MRYVWLDEYLLGKAGCDEGLCVQCMHIGAYDDEPVTIAVMDQFIREQGYENDFSETRMHHEIYLSDARRARSGEVKDRHKTPDEKGRKVK